MKIRDISCNFETETHMKFIGRHKELKNLGKLVHKKSSSLVVVQGRRRVGKSRLIEEFGKKFKFYRFSGIPPTPATTAQSERDIFSKQLTAQVGIPEVFADDWSKLFLLLAEKIDKGRIVVLFDEISWMGKNDPDFLGKLKDAWDFYFKKNPNLIFFLCGSASVWIDENILSSTGFLGRISYRLFLEELTIHECNEFWSNMGGHYASYEKLKLLSVTGGIPRYLEEIKPHLSAEENIKDLCFIKGGPLVTEFEEIFSDLFSKKSPTYKRIIKTLVEGPLEVNQICTKLKIENTGFISQCLSNLLKSGFVTRDYTWHIDSNEISKLSHFRLSDNYIRFYLKYIDKYLGRIELDEYALKSITTLPAWETIMGLQFENLVLKNRHLIKNYLNLSPDEIISDNPFFQRKTNRYSGCQIDYLIQSKYNILYICEIKFSKYPINIQVIKEVQAKMSALYYPKGFSLRPVLIHVNGVEDRLVDEDFFSHIIDFSEWLQMNDKGTFND